MFGIVFPSPQHLTFPLIVPLVGTTMSMQGGDIVITPGAHPWHMWDHEYKKRVHGYLDGNLKNKKLNSYWRMIIQFSKKNYKFREANIVLI
jgi:hypothetical protein